MKKKIFKTILFIILLIIAIILIRFTYNFCYYQKLVKVSDKVNESRNFTCYYYNRGERFDEETNKFKVMYSKMGVRVKDDKSVFYNYNIDNDNSLYGATFYDEKANNENVYIEYETNRFQVQPNYMPVSFHSRLINYPVSGAADRYLKNATLKEKLYYYFSLPQAMLSIKFSSVEEDGKEYIVLEYKNLDTKVYFNKETLLAEKRTIVDSKTNEVVINEKWKIEVRKCYR